MIAHSYMDNERLGTLIRKVATRMLKDQTGNWQFEIGENVVLVITDQTHNRMRIMTPVAEFNSVADERMQILLAANFDRALDARYCVNEDLLWSAFLHPLEELDDDQFLDALKQVVTLANNYGSTYTSSELVFGG